MTEVQKHRGPDGTGFLFIDGSDSTCSYDIDGVRHAAFGRVALGHRRLAILDTSDAGLQPMPSPDRQAWIVHNGEIYNYLELRAELEQLGHRFTTGTDTEVALAAYRQWGTDCFSRFNGMWGMAIWDQQAQQLVLSRDRFGIKPLHIARTADTLFFASEIKGILQSGCVKAALNRRTLAEFLRLSTVDHSRHTFFEGIESFPPGHFAIVDPDRPVTWELTAYYDLSSAVDLIPEDDMETAVRRFRDLFHSSVALRMRSDVPVGSCLSGGLDSSSVVCTAASLVDHGSIHTFTSAFDYAKHDEREWSDMVNEAVSATPRLVMPAAHQFANDYEDLLWHQEEPFPSTSIYAQWRLMREAQRDGIPVLLDGQGGDETLCGYRKYALFHLLSLLRERRLLTLASTGIELLAKGDRNLLDWRAGGSRYLPSALQAQTWSLEQALDPVLRADWNNVSTELGLVDSLRNRQIADVERFSVPSLLRYEDRNSMAWSIETRVPFLDHRLVEYAIALPTDVKIRQGQSKMVLRHALRGVVPDAVLDRKTKMGFNTPMAEWLTGDLRSMIVDRLSGPDCRVRALIDTKRVLDAFERMGRRDYDAISKVFHVFIVDAWMERFDVEV